MEYKIFSSRRFDKELKKLDPKQLKEAKEWFSTIDIKNNPRSSGKALTGNLKGVWRYANKKLKLRLAIVINDQLKSVKLIGIERRDKTYKKINTKYYSNEVKEELNNKGKGMGF